MVSGKQQLLDSGSYTVVPNRIFRMGLSVRAITLYCWMASNKENYHFSISGLYKKTEASWVNMGRDSIKKAMKELQDLGLVTKVIIRDPKKGSAVKHDYCLNLDPSEILFDVDGNPLKGQDEVTGKPIVREEDNAKKAKMSKLRSKISQPKMTKEMVDDFYPSKENEENDDKDDVTPSISMLKSKRLKSNQTGNPSDCKSDTNKNKENNNNLHFLHSSEDEDPSPLGSVGSQAVLPEPKNKKESNLPTDSEGVLSHIKSAQKRRKANPDKKKSSTLDKVDKVLAHIATRMPEEFGSAVRIKHATNQERYVMRNALSKMPDQKLSFLIEVADFAMGYREDLRDSFFNWMKRPPCPRIISPSFFARHFARFVEAFTTPKTFERLRVRKRKLITDEITANTHTDRKGSALMTPERQAKINARREKDAQAVALIQERLASKKRAKKERDRSKKENSLACL